MFLPILNYADGYGFTYGARLSTVDYLGFGERLSVPLTWGGTRRAAIEFDRGFKTGPISRVTSTFGIWNRENPRYEIREQRVELTGRIERDFAHIVRVGVDASKSSVSFGEIDDDVWTVGANAAVDTRSNPIFPGNAVYLGAGWNALNVQGRSRINRYTTDARGYLRPYGQAVLAARAQYTTADAALPIYERILVGGSSNLRGFDTGAFDGDKMFGTSVELRAPITSAIHGAKFGLSAFTDAVRVADYGASLKDSDWRRGVGGGVFIVMPLFTVHMGVGHGLDGGGNHFFLSSGFSF
jgi:outer membrane protein assembly factor BamA